MPEQGVHMHKVHLRGITRYWGPATVGPKCGSIPQIATPAGVITACMTTDTAQVTCKRCLALLAKRAARGGL